MTLSRGFFYQTVEDQDFFWKESSDMPCLGKITDKNSDLEYFISRNNNTVLIYLSDLSWIYGEGTYYRADIRKYIKDVIGESLLRKKGEDTWLIWSTEPSFFPKNTEGLQYRPAQMLETEAARIWSWIEHICSQSRSVQRLGVPGGLDEWNNIVSLRLPPPL